MLLSRTALLAVLVSILLIPASSFASTLPSSNSSSASISPNLPAGNSYSNNISNPGAPSLNGSSVKIPISLPAVLSRATPLGEVAPSTSVSLGIVLPTRDRAGLDQYINDISSPLSKEYRQFLSPQQYSELYGPDSSEASLLASYFQSKGLVASLDKSNPDLMLVSGTALDAERALQVSIQSFSLGGTTFYSSTSMPQLPMEFSNIQNIFGLTNYGSDLGMNISAVPMVRTLGPITGSPSQTSANAIYYSPSEIRQIYNATSLLNQGYTGSGVTIAIVDAFGDPYIQQELSNFSSEFNLPQTTINQICIDGPCDYYQGISQGWNLEIALDVEWAHAMAPGAAINLYIASNNSVPLYDAVQAAVAAGTNSIITMSWGSPENTIASSSPIAPVFGENYPWLDQVLQQAAAEGITVFASTGDWGAYDQATGETLPYGGAIYPSTDPYVTAVGGTSLYMNSTGGYFQSPYFNATGGYGKETAWSWNDVSGGATGGGYSTIFGAPSWQQGPGFSGGSRGVPDVSWDADIQTGVVVAVQSGGAESYYIVGGTSVGSPSWAGSLALMDQKAGQRLGFIDPTLYSILNNPAEYSKAFHDVTVGNNNPDSATPGWDPATGIGTPNLGELANYIAPTGSLGVAVNNTLTGNLAASYSYGSSIGFSAVVTGPTGSVTSGAVTASITGPGGQPIATGIPLSFNSVTKAWIGSYTIKPTDPPGEWTAQIAANAGSSFGTGYTTFSVGDGITLFSPYYNATSNTASFAFFQVGQIINVSAAVTSPDGSCCVTSGSFRATFTQNTLSGKLEGNIPLSYNSTAQLWMGSFKIPRSVDQGAWVLQVSGTDSKGNQATTYSWVNVGLNVLLATDSPTYVLGDTVRILSAPLYANGTLATQGSMQATIYSGSRLITQVPLSFSLLDGLWMGSFNLTMSDPTGFYSINVGGNDGFGNLGSFSTVVRVAPYNLQGQLNIPNKEISVSGGSEPSISAKISYPDGTRMTSGSVEAFVSLDLGGGVLVPISHDRLTYQASTQSFVGPDLLPAPASPLTTLLGDYVVSVQAFDYNGNYGNFTTTFFVNGISHGPVTISSNPQFTSLNGVIGGLGTPSNPYIIAGWNTSSISVSGSVTESYAVLNNWVEGSSGDGIVINTPNSVGSMVANDYTMSNRGNGLYVNNVPGVVVSGVVANGNGLDGIIIANDSLGSASELSGSVAVGNSGNGIVVENTQYLSILTDVATSNSNYGFYVNNCFNASMIYDNATSNSVGVYISGTPKQSYGEAEILAGNFNNNGVGIQINGLNQRITNGAIDLSTALIGLNVELRNNIGLLAANDSVISLEINIVGLNNYGVIIKNSLPLAVDNIIARNSETALNIAGAFLGTAHCEVKFTNSSIFSYSSCIAGNILSENGGGGSGTKSGSINGASLLPVANGLSISNLNGSLIYANSANSNTGNGIDLRNITSSVVSKVVATQNSGSGISITGGQNNRINANQLDGNLNGLLVSGGSGSTIDMNDASSNALNGIMLLASANNVVTNNTAVKDASGCGQSPGCNIAAGIQLSGSSNNLVSLNNVSSNTASGSIGAGIYLRNGSLENNVSLNNVTGNYAGVVLDNSYSNTVTKNSIASNTYGIYLVNAVANFVISNTFLGDTQNQYPNQPSVFFTNMTNGTRVIGEMRIFWNSTGQGITNETISVDGISQSVSGENFLWNSSTISDGTHTLTIKIIDSGGFSASASVTVSTFNHQFVMVDTFGPNDLPIPGTRVFLKNSTVSYNVTTDSNGLAIFKGMSPGNYVASTSINGTTLSAPVDFQSNSTLVLFTPTLSTTAYAKLSSGTSVPIMLSGNITASQLSNVVLSNANGVYSLSFKVDGLNGTFGMATISIPKTSIPSGLVPKVTIDGIQVANLSYTQDKNYYYIVLSTHFSSHDVVIQFSESASFIIRYLLAIVGAIALVVATVVILAFRRRNRNLGKGSTAGYYAVASDKPLSG